jgi:hypothetical protein
MTLEQMEPFAIGQGYCPSRGQWKGSRRKEAPMMRNKLCDQYIITLETKEARSRLV